MIELIKINVTEGGKHACSARELHEFLGAGSDVTTWFRNQVVKCMLEDGVDFTQVSGKSTGGRPSLDFAITINAAKEISMMNGGDKGKQARLYFIECERKLKQSHLVPQSFSEALMLAAQNQKRIEEQQKQIAVLEPKASYFDSVKDAQNAITMEEVVKLLNNTRFGRTRLFKFLRDKKVFTEKNLPYQVFMDREYFRVIQNSYVDSKGALHTYPQVLAYPKGVAYINKLITTL